MIHGLERISGTRPVALVTGGTRRIGAAIASALAATGCDVVITHRLPPPPPPPGGPGSHTASIRLELSDTAEVERVAAELARQLPRLDVLVHNAAAYGPTPLATLTADAALAYYRTNALAPLLLSRALAPLLSASTLTSPASPHTPPHPIGGAIVSLCDIHALGDTGAALPRAGFSAYAMSKAALVEMTLTLARELAAAPPRGVRVNAVAPGVVAFPDSGPESDPAFQARYLARVPLGRAGTPHEAAAAVRFLALEAGYCTGQIIRIDGGRSVA